jgi:hypothetical protein
MERADRRETEIPVSVSSIEKAKQAPDKHRRLCGFII